MNTQRGPIRHDDWHLNEVPEACLLPIFWIKPVGAPNYRVDLTGLRDGTAMAPSGAAGFKGRPGFAYAFAHWLSIHRPQEFTYRAYAYGLTTLLRFLDNVDPEGVRAAPEFLTDQHGIQLIDWLDGKGLKGYALVRSVVTTLYPPGQVPLIWPTAKATPTAEASKDITREQALDMYGAFREEASRIKAMFKEGAALAAAGGDPRGRSFPRGTRPWRVRENHAWMAREMINTAYTDADVRYRPSGRPITIFGGSHGPEYIAPCLPEDAGRCVGGKLRWFSFSFYDAAVFLWLFLQKTGWNLGTALAIDISSDEAWFETDESMPDHRTIRGYKGRSGADQMITVRADRQWHPFQIVQFMVEQTEPLRDALRRKLAKAWSMADENTLPDFARRIADMEAALKSPWLYHRLRNGVDPTSIKHHDASRINEVLRLVAARRGIDCDKEGGWSTSDARDFLVRSTYEKGMDILGAQAVVQHASPATTGRNYLNVKRFKTAAEARFRTAQVAFFAEIEAERPIDLVGLKILFARGEITAEQEAKLRDPAMRTRLGMGCKDATRPPPEIAPGHPEGRFCAVQRCTGCVHGVVFEDSLDGLVRRHVVLRSIQRLAVGQAAWRGSSFEAEADSVEETLKLFDAQKVESARLKWQAFVEEKGAAFVQDTFPAY